MPTSSTQLSPLEKALRIFTEIKPGEGASAILLTLNVFLLLTSYYVIKPVRDALINAMPSGPEYKSYMGGAIAIALIFAVPTYARYAAKLPRNRLVVGVTVFFAIHLLLFAIATRFPSTNTWLPLAFYLWVGIFNMMVVAQFWAFANDIYTEPQGKRLFALIGIGASAGAMAGGALAKWLPIRPQASLQSGCDATLAQVGYLSTLGLLLVAAGLLCVCALLTQWVHLRESSSTPPPTSEQPPQKPSSKGAFGLVFSHRYLLLLAAFSLVFTLVNTNGEYMISKLVNRFVFETVDQCHFSNPATKAAFVDGMFTSWYGDFYFYVNVAGVLLQAFAVSRLVKWGGIKIAFFVFPLVAALGAIAVLLFPILSLLRSAKIAENSTDYSVNNTVRNMLWLPTTKAMKYRAKQAVDTFFVRLGDVGSAVLVYALANLLEQVSSSGVVRVFAGINIVLIFLWIYIAVRILHEQNVLRHKKQQGELNDTE